jgi:flagellar M-ring protein FliF
VEFRLADNGTTVLVPAAKVDEVRLDLAGAGLPKSGRIGFEIFDKTNISLTDFGEHVNYGRALEGELEKTIKSMTEIEDARVHISFPKDSVFLDSKEAAKASVLLHVKPGFHLQPENVVAITNLVASAVENLSPDAVSVVDTRGKLLSRVRKPYDDPSELAESTLDYKHQIEKDLTSKVEATLLPLLGDGKFRVGVTVDCDFSTSVQTDEVYDPSRAAISSSQKTEDLIQGSANGGPPGTASNLPRSEIKQQANPPAAPPPPAPNAAAPNSAAASTAAANRPVSSRNTQSDTFQNTRTVREIKTPRGITKKISAALLIDQDVEWQGKGNQRKRILIPPSPEKLKSVHDIVAGVLGINTDRGDLLVVETLPFEQTRNAEETSLEAAKPLPSGKLALKDLILANKLMIGGGVGLLFVALLVGYMLRKPKAAAVSAKLAEKQMLEPGKAEGEAEPAPGAAQIGEVSATGKAPSGSAKEVAGASAKELEESPFFLPEMTNHTKALLDHLRKGIAKDPQVAANVIRSWMEEG